MTGKIDSKATFSVLFAENFVFGLVAENFVFGLVEMGISLANK